MRPIKYLKRKGRQATLASHASVVRLGGGCAFFPHVCLRRNGSLGRQPGATAKCHWLLFLLCTTIPLRGFAWENEGVWGIVGSVVDVRSTLAGAHFTNTLTITGLYDAGRFSLDVIPVKTDDEIAESVAWDGERLRLIQRFPEEPHKGLPRDRSLAYVERSIFSRYATHPALAAMVTLAGTNSVQYLLSGQEPIILAGARVFPEEQNTYSVTFTTNGLRVLEAHTPGREITDSGEERLIPGFKDGFLRWKFVWGAPDPMTGGSAGINLPFEYRRFFPSGSKLFEYRTVKGALTLHPEGRVVSDFKPRITESRLKVLDYSSRKDFYPFTKGLSDSAYGYELTNLAWNFDEGKISAWASEVTSGWAIKGVPENFEETRTVSAHDTTKRGVAFWCLVAIFLSLPAVLWQLKRKEQNNPEQKAQS